MKIKFFHQRKYDKNKVLLTHGGATIAYEIDDKGLVHKSAAAVCHKKDAYCKHTGRVKAKGRLLSPRYTIISKPPIPEQDFIKQYI